MYLPSNDKKGRGKCEARLLPLTASVESVDFIANVRLPGFLLDANWGGEFYVRDCRISPGKFRSCLVIYICIVQNADYRMPTMLDFVAVAGRI